MQHPPQIKTKRWHLILVPDVLGEDSTIRTAATFEAADTMSVKEIIDHIKVGMSTTALKRIINSKQVVKGQSSMIQIQYVPEDADPVWKEISNSHRFKLVPFAVFKTQSEFAALIGVETNTVSQALYKARSKRNPTEIAIVKGFGISRCEDLKGIE